MASSGQFREMNAPQREAIQQFNMVVNHNPRVQAVGNTVQIPGQSGLSTPGFSQVEDGG
jgi:hypothetical protein